MKPEDDCCFDWKKEINDWKDRALVEINKKERGEEVKVCPQCGRCPTCGRRYIDEYQPPYNPKERWWGDDRVYC